MEDLAHFIQSMSEKYGIPDADGKKSREFQDMAGTKQIQECPSSAASNSYNAEACSGPAGSWEYLSIFISGQTLDSKDSHGSRPLHSSIVPFNSENGSHLHAYARMIDINVEPEPESPTPSHVLVNERNTDDMLCENVVVSELGTSAPFQKDFSNIVTMSDYLQSLYCSKESSQELRLRDDDVNDVHQVQTLTWKSDETTCREDPSSPSQNNQDGNDHLYLEDPDDYPQSVIRSCRSHDIEDGTSNSNSVVVEHGVQYGVKCETISTGIVQRQYDSWNLAKSESQPKCPQKNSTWKPMSTSSNGISSPSLSEQVHARSVRQTEIVSSFVSLDDEADMGDNGAFQEDASSSRASTSRSCHPEGRSSETEGHEEVHTNRSMARLKMNLRDPYCNNQLRNISSDSHEQEARGCRSSNNNHRETQHNYGVTPGEERGRDFPHGISDELVKTQEGRKSIVEEQTQESELGFSGFGLGEIETKFGHMIPGEQQRDRSGDPLHRRNHEFGIKQKVGTIMLREKVSRYTGFDQDNADSIQASQEPVGSLHERCNNVGGTQQLLDDFTPRVEATERRAGPSADSSIYMGGKQDSFGDSISLGEKEQRAPIQSKSNLLADINHNVLIHREQERKPTALSSNVVYANAQGSREDSCNRLREEHNSNSNLKATTFEYHPDYQLIREQEIPKRSLSKDSSATHAGNREKLETSERWEHEGKRGTPQEKRIKNVANHFILVSADSYLQCEKEANCLPSSSEMHYRSSLLDNATENLISETEPGNSPFHSNQTAQDSLENTLSATPSALEASSAKVGTLKKNPCAEDDIQPKMESSTNSRLTKNQELENGRQQTPGSLVLPRKDMSGSYASDETRLLESWDLGEDFNLPSCESWNSGSIKSKWMYINKILCDNGFSPLNSSCMSTSSENLNELLDSLEDVVRNYARREKLVQELLAERDSLRQEEEQNDKLTLKLESDVETLKHKLVTSEQRAELAAAASQKTFATLRKEHQRLEATHASALQRCSQLEHVCRAKERSLRKLQERIQESVKKEQCQRSTDRELYEKLKHKVAISQKAQGEIIESNFLMRDLKPACIVGIYERQRAASEAEMNQLREENSRLCNELRDKENCLLSKAMLAVEADQAELDKREHELIEQLTEIEKQLTKKISQCRQLDSRGNSALLPLEVNRKEDLKKESVKYLKPMKPESVEDNSSMLLLQRLQSEAVQERRNNQLLEEIAKKKSEQRSTNSTCQTSIVNGCTNEKCHEFLQDVCSKLKIADPLRINDAIDSLLKVVTAVPRMESFIDSVCEVVFNEGCMFLSRGNSECVEQTPEAIPDILRSWLQQLQCTEELQQFKDTVCTQLWERYDDKAEKHHMNSKLAAASVKDLINIERQYLLSQDSYREAQTLLKAEPQKLLHRIIGHFQMLFEIPRLEGVMAVMNSVYIQISEYHNFARALCSILCLPKDSGANTIISTITGILNKVSNPY